MREFLRRYWVEVVALAFIAACLVYFFGWHEFDLLNAVRRDQVVK